MLRSLLMTRNDPAPLAARLVLGAVIFPHGAQHALGWFGGYGFAGTLEWMTGTLGFPLALAAPAIVVELLAPIALIVGLGGRLAALGIAGIMAGAASTHVGNGFFMNWFGSLPAGAEGFEYHLLGGALALVIALSGSGAWSLDRLLAADHDLHPAATDRGERPERSRIAARAFSSAVGSAILTAGALQAGGDAGTDHRESAARLDVTPAAVSQGLLSGPPMTG